ncbi:neuropilin-2-like [Pecten maximus]|uniref:neuropilin-2-like n=1 Tax=Pecten maximus TaxID=6579 RepID=UPI00145834F2|nr:neuropilin-2-like [Pecten maximus]
MLLTRTRVMKIQLWTIINLMVLIANIDCRCVETLINGPNGVSNSSLTVSSWFNRIHCQPKFVRIGNVEPYAWCPATASISEYLQVELRYLSTVTGFVIQGRNYQYTESITMKISRNGVNWKDVTDNSGDRKIFTTNTDGTTLVTRAVNEISGTKFVRIYPETWNDWPSFRLEILGLSGTSSWAGKIGVPDIVLPVLQQITAANNGLCGKACHKHQSCGSFMFDFDTNECHLYSTKSFNVTTSESASDRKVYYVDNRECHS